MIFCLTVAYAQPPATPTGLVRIDPGMRGDSICRTQRLVSTFPYRGDSAMYRVLPVSDARNYVYNDSIMNRQTSLEWVGVLGTDFPVAVRNTPWAVVRNRSFTAPFGDTVEVIVGPNSSTSRPAMAATATTIAMAAVPQMTIPPYVKSYTIIPSKSGVTGRGEYVYRISSTTGAYFQFLTAGASVTNVTAGFDLLPRGVTLTASNFAPFGDTLTVTIDYNQVRNAAPFNSTTASPIASLANYETFINGCRGFQIAIARTATSNPVMMTDTIRHWIQFTPQDVNLSVRASNRDNESRYVYTVPPSFRMVGGTAQHFRYGGMPAAFSANNQIFDLVTGAAPVAGTSYAVIINLERPTGDLSFGDSVEIFIGPTDGPITRTLSTGVVTIPTLATPPSGPGIWQAALPFRIPAGPVTGTPSNTNQANHMSIQLDYFRTPTVFTNIAGLPAGARRMSVYDWRSCAFNKSIRIIGQPPAPYITGPTSICQTNPSVIRYYATVPMDYYPNPSMENSPVRRFTFNSATPPPIQGWNYPASWTVNRYGTNGLNDTIYFNVNSSALGSIGSVSAKTYNECDSSEAVLNSLSVTVYAAQPAQPIAIVGTPTPPATFLVGQPNICPTNNYSYSINTVPFTERVIWSWTDTTQVTPRWTKTFTVGVTPNPYQIDILGTEFGDSSGRLSVVCENACGRSLERIYNITNFRPQRPATISGNVAVCGGGLATYTAAVVPGAIGYSWEVVGAATRVSASADSLTIQLSITGAVTLRVRARNYPSPFPPIPANGCESRWSDPIYITTVAPATPTFVNNVERVCSGKMDSIVVTKVPGATAYEWILPAGYTAVGTPSDTLFYMPGTNPGTVQVRATNACGVSAYALRSVEIIPSPLPRPSTIAGSTFACPGSRENYVITMPIILNNNAVDTFILTMPLGWQYLRTSAPDTVDTNSTIRIPVPGNYVAPTGLTANQFRITLIPSTNPGFVLVSAQNKCATSGVQTLFVNIDEAPARPSLSGPNFVCWDSLDFLSPNAHAMGRLNTFLPRVPSTNGTIVGGACNENNPPYASVAGIEPDPSTNPNNVRYQVTSVLGATHYEWKFPCNWKANQYNNATGTMVPVTCAVPVNQYRVNAGDTVLADRITTVNFVDVNSGSYSGYVYCRAWNGCRYSAWDSLFVNVVPRKALPALTDTIVGDTVICFGNTKTYSVPNVYGAQSYRWVLPQSWCGTARWSGFSTTNTITASASSLPNTCFGDYRDNLDTLYCYAKTACGDTLVDTVIIRFLTGAPTQPSPIEARVLDAATATYTTLTSPTGTTNLTTCLGAAVIFAVPTTTISGEKATEYEWTLPSGWSLATPSVSNITTPDNQAIFNTSLTPSPALVAGYTYIRVIVGGNGTLSVRPKNNCGVGPARDVFVAGDGFLPYPPIRIDGPIVICRNSPAFTYQVPPVTGATRYEWMFADRATVASVGRIAEPTAAIINTPGNYNTTGGTATNYVQFTVSQFSQVAWVHIYPNTLGNVVIGLRDGAGAVVPGVSDFTYTVSATDIRRKTRVAVNFSMATAGTYRICLLPGTTAACLQEPGAGAGVVNGGVVSGFANVAPATSNNYFYDIRVGSYFATPGEVTTTTNVYSGTLNLLNPPLSAYANSVNTGVTVRAVNSCGSSNQGGVETEIDVQLVKQAPNQPSVISGDTLVCRGRRLTYSVLSDPEASSYTWSLPTGWTGYSTTRTIDVTVGTDTGTIVVYAQNSCGLSTPRIMYVRVADTLAAPTRIIGDTLVCVNSFRTFSVPVVPGAVQYTWTLPTGSTYAPTSSPTLGTITAIIGTSGTITVSAYNACGNGRTVSMNVRVDSLPKRPDTLYVMKDTCGPGIRTFVARYNNTTLDSFARSYTWVLPAGWLPIGATNRDTIRVNVTTPGILNVVANNNCGSSLSRALAVAVPFNFPAQPSPISGPTLICEGNSVVYAIPGTLNATSYQWTVPAGWILDSTTNGTGTAIRVRPVASTATQTITVVAKNGCGSSTPQTINVVSGTLPTQPGPITSSLGSLVCRTGKNYTLSINPVPGATSYTWTLPPNWIINGPSNGPSITGISGQPGQIRVRANNPCGSSRDTMLDVSYQPVPVNAGVITGDTVICSSSTTSATYTIAPIPGVDPAGYLWTIPTGWTFVGASTGNSVQVRQGGTSGLITVIGTNVCGERTNPTTFAVSIVRSVPPAAPAINGNTVVCDGQFQTYSILPILGASDYVWTFPAGWTTSGPVNGTSVNVRATGPGNVTVVARNACGNSPATSIVITVISKPILNNGTRCGEGSVTLTAPMNFDYRWYDAPTGGTLVGSTNTFVTPSLTATRSYYVSRYIDGCETERTKVDAIIFPVPARPTIAATDTNLRISTPAPTVTSTFVNNSTDRLTAGLQWRWLINGAEQSSNRDSLRYTFTEPGTYQLSLRAITPDGCTITSAVTRVTVTSTVSMDGAKAIERFTVYPNPTTGMVNLKFNNPSNGKVEFNVVDSKGATVFQATKQLPAGDLDEALDLSGLSAGQYFMNITAGDKLFNQTITIVK